MQIIDTSWLTEDYMKSLGYNKVNDDGKYGVYVNEHFKVKSLTYGDLPKDYRKISFCRDKIGVMLGVKADWDTRHSITNACATSKEIFEILLNACT